MTWIDCNKKLPKHEEKVLVINSKKAQAVCVFIDTIEMNIKLVENGFVPEIINEKQRPYSFCSQEVSGNVLNNVTHWRYLPSPPKD